MCLAVSVSLPSLCVALPYRHGNTQVVIHDLVLYRHLVKLMLYPCHSFGHSFVLEYPAFLDAPLQVIIQVPQLKCVQSHLQGLCRPRVDADRICIYCHACLVGRGGRTKKPLADSVPRKRRYCWSERSEATKSGCAVFAFPKVQRTQYRTGWNYQNVIGHRRSTLVQITFNKKQGITFLPFTAVHIKRKSQSYPYRRITLFKKRVLQRFHS